MSNKNILAVAAFLTTASMIAAATNSPSLAANQADQTDDSAEYAKLSGAKLSLAEASMAAEKQFGGKAVNAALDNEQQAATFEIELMTDAGTKIVSVDGQSGKAQEVADDHGQDGPDKE